MNKCAQYWLLTICLLFVIQVIEARHIIGGEVTYECTSPGNYDFTMTIYRDCACTNCAYLDNVAEIAIYRCGNENPCNSMSQATPYTTLQVDLGQVSDVQPPDYPCLTIPPDICVEKGVYNFSASLPLSSDSYHIIYQRCCRNVTITNLINPEDAGATYSVEITPEAQTECNNSPVFDAFPPTVICVGQDVNFDHSATDADGDQLVYSFCSPLLGGGPVGTNDNPGDPSLCNGVQPTPPCPPPYNNVSFILPTYTALAPMGGDPIVSINSNTGLISGVPQLQGQYVVGVCVSEYRNGVLMSELRRDFQFNVSDCEPTVIADIQSDEVIGGQNFVVNSCGNETISFVNQSYQQQFIDQYSWNFDINGTIQTVNTWDATMTFPGIGTYEGNLILNPGTECGDTAHIFVNIYPEINADFSHEYDTCVAGPVAFTDMSFSGSGMITNWDWTFGDGELSTEQHPIHDYLIPGDLPVTLQVTDINECVATETKVISYFPIPNLIVIAPSSFEGCAPGDIFFNNLSTPIDDTYTILWDFGDGTTGGEISPTHTYEDPGTYTVNVDITSPIGCQTDTIFPNLITIEGSPIADYIFNPDQPSNLIPTVNFTNQSTDAISSYWDFGGLGSSFEEHPVFTFPDTGMHEVQLIVTHLSGCMDTLTQIIDVIPEVRYFMPNAFTPNNDDLNDGFIGKGKLDGATNFNFTIWNRWGELVFETDDPNEAWNGKKKNVGNLSQNGVYLYLVTFTGPRGEQFELKGYATLIR